jgi:hypothetical protein
LQLAVAGWRVRYFQPLKKEEHLIYVSTDGRLARYEHLLDEKAPGGTLSLEEACRRAAGYLAQNYQLDISSWKLVESKLEKREARVDHHLVWEEPNPVVAEAYVRIEVDVRGDEVAGYRPFLKVPEEWLRELTKLRIMMIIGGVFMVLVCIGILIVGVRLLPEHTFRWRVYAALTLPVCGANLLTQINRIRYLGSGYDTSVPWQSYVFMQIGSMVLAIMGIAVLTLLLTLAADLFFASRVSVGRLLGQGPLIRSPYLRDALVVGLAMGLWFHGLEDFCLCQSTLPGTSVKHRTDFWICPRHLSAGLKCGN